ncbi:MAG TPA: endolytic transglycosylase MltG, partial [Anaerolineales bacterium]|nr:endolytic transglycosylase MltG [Anaerolineales bacterium]
MHIERHGPRRRDTARGLLKFVVFNVSIAALVIAGAVIYLTLSNRQVIADLGPAASGLNPAEQIALTGYLSLYHDALNTPAGTDSTSVTFVVEPGEDAGTVAARLAEMGIVNDATLLRMYMRYRGLDDQIEAGNFTLNKTLTVPALATALTDAAPDAVQVTVWEGWRLEQIANSLAAQPHLAFSRDEFARLTGRGAERLNT